MMEFSVDGRFGVLWQGLQRVVLPPHCLLCDQPSDGAADLCSGCSADLQRNRICCPRCALPLQTPAPLCGECLQREPPFAAAFAPFVYAHPFDLLVTRLKFGRSLAAGRVLTGLWLAASSELPALPQALIPVPLHPDRLRERGYNQALELARPIARALGVPLASRALTRLRATSAQTNLDATTRRRNLRGAFAADTGALVDGPAPLTHVAIFDDVMTTGATLREAARMLRRAGVARVEVWALARAPRGR